MAKSEKKLFAFLLFIAGLTLFNSFYKHFLNSYNFIIFLITILILFKYLFGIEKDHHRYSKDIILKIIIILIFYKVIYFLLGLFITFTKNNNYLTLSSFKTVIIPLVLSIILKEILRYNFLKKSDQNKCVTCLVIIIFILLDLTNQTSKSLFKSGYLVFAYLAINMLPSIFKNIVLSYISINYGYKPVIVWLLITTLINYFLPILPNFNDYINSIILLLEPIIIWLFINDFYEKSTDKYIYSNQKRFDLSFSVLIFIIIIIIYFVSGYFKYYALSIGSGSMYPNLNIGDVVIIEKTSIDNINIGDVIAYNYHDVIVVHRLVRKDNIYYYTKGDNNEKIDDYIIYEDMIIGKLKLKIPYLGLPAVWVNKI